VLQAIKRAAGLHCSPEIRSVRLLRGNHAAARPLTTAVGAGESNRTDDAVAIDDGAPHVEVESAIVLAARIRQRAAQRVVAGKARARSGRCAALLKRGHGQARRGVTIRGNQRSNFSVSRCNQGIFTGLRVPPSPPDVAVVRFNRLSWLAGARSTPHIT
jgi:hypothetical protein